MRKALIVLPWILLATLTIFVFRKQFIPQVNPVTPQTTMTGMSLVTPSSQVKGAQDMTGSDLVTVTRVVDGDTIEVKAESYSPERAERVERVRYVGIDTPETVDPRKPVQCFGQEASNKNKELVLGKKVRLEKDISETDKYGRLLRYVWVENIFVNDYLIRNGFAKLDTFPPDVKYASQFQSAQKEAQDNNRGLWAPKACTESGASTPGVASQTAPTSDCLIKGNINSSGDKIYHTPGQRYYDKTQIDESAGERWFCTEDEAISAGWRKSKV